MAATSCRVVSVRLQKCHAWTSGSSAAAIVDLPPPAPPTMHASRPAAASTWPRSAPKLQASPWPRSRSTATSVW